MFKNPKLKDLIDEINADISNLSAVFNEQKLLTEIAELEEKMNEPNFWDDAKTASIVAKQVSFLKDKLHSFKSYFERANIINDLYKVVEADAEFDLDYEDCVSAFHKSIAEFRTKTLLGGKYDLNSAIITVKAGAGGTESMDWANMLYRMYCGYATKNGLKIELTDFEEGNEAGYKSLEFRVVGNYAYGMLKNESGVHRLVRISPFDANKRRHTSFASVEVSPEVDDAPEININKNDLRIDTFRSSGAGGQHINKTESAIRITHIPTGIVVTCQNERSAMQNREQAFKILYSKLLSRALEEKQRAIDEKNSQLKKIEWGSQIRSYVFCPYTLVKDHRTNYEESDVFAVMNGEISGFINDMIKLQNSNN